MGLDGISINQLRVGSDINSGELNKLQDNFPQIVDGLTQGQKINPDEKKEKETNKKRYRQNKANEDEQTNRDDEENIEKISQYDLSDTKKYTLKVDEKTNTIVIVEKETQRVIQTFSPELLSNLTKYLKNYTGVLINKRY